jgi:hypothetical protein
MCERILLLNIFIFYSSEAPVLWRPHRRKLALSPKHFHNAFLMK